MYCSGWNSCFLGYPPIVLILIAVYKKGEVSYDVGIDSLPCSQDLPIALYELMCTLCLPSRPHHTVRRISLFQQAITAVLMILDSPG